MSSPDENSDPYEDYFTLEEALYSLEFWPYQFQGKDKEIEDEFWELTGVPWWRAPVDFLRTFKPVKINHPLNRQPVSISLRKAVRLFEESKKNTLLSEFRAGNYPIFGYASPRSPNDKRQAIPTDVWGKGVEIDWGRSVVRNGSLVFENLRVVDVWDGSKRRELQETVDDSPPSLPSPRQLPKGTPLPPPKPPRERGQPSKVGATCKAYKKLKTEGAINFNLSLRKNAPKISQRVFEEDPPRPENKIQKGPDFRTIKKAIGTQFAKDQSDFLNAQLMEKKEKEIIV